MPIRIKFISRAGMYISPAEMYISRAEMYIPAREMNFTKGGCLFQYASHPVLSRKSSFLKYNV